MPENLHSIATIQRMQRRCPACGSSDIRRSSSPSSGGVVRNFIYSAYRCRACRERFPVVSRNVYAAAIVACAGVLMAVVSWTLLNAIDSTSDVSLPVAAAPENRFHELAKLAEKDDAVAQYKLARMYRYGEGVSQDTSASWRWLERAAHQGNVDAQFEVAMILREGKGVVQDFEQGLKWLRLAAEGGNPDAQHELGLMY